MILFSILLTILILVVIGVLSIGGAVLLTFGDLIVCVLIIVLLVKLFKKIFKKKES